MRDEKQNWAELDRSMRSHRQRVCADEQTAVGAPKSAAGDAWHPTSRDTAGAAYGGANNNEDRCVTSEWRNRPPRKAFKKKTGEDQGYNPPVQAEFPVVN